MDTFFLSRLYLFWGRSVRKYACAESLCGLIVCQCRFTGFTTTFLECSSELLTPAVSINNRSSEGCTPPCNWLNEWMNECMCVSLQHTAQGLHQQWVICVLHLTTVENCHLPTFTRTDYVCLLRASRDLCAPLHVSEASVWCGGIRSSLSSFCTTIGWLIVAMDISPRHVCRQ